MKTSSYDRIAPRISTPRIRLIGGLLGLLALPGPSRTWLHAAEPKPEAFITLTRTPLEEKKLPTNVTVIPREKIERSGAQNVAEVLKREVGTVLTQTSDLGSLHQIMLRGFNSANVLFMVDEKPIRNLFTGTIDLSQIPVDQVDRIEVVRGAGSALYGPNTHGGVVHIITKRPKAYLPTLELGSQTRSYGEQIHHANFGMKRDRIEAFFTGVKSKTDGFRQNSDWDSTAFTADTGYDFGTWGKSELDVSFVQSEVGVPGIAVHPVTGLPLEIRQFDGNLERTANAPSDRQRDRSESLRYQHHFQHEDLFGAKLRLYGEKKDQTFINYFGATKFESTNTAITQGLETQFDFPRVGFTLGSQLELDKFESSSVRQIVSTIWGVYAQEKLEFSDRWVVILGIRGDRNKDYGSQVNPRFSSTYRITDAWKISVNAGRSFKAPSFANRFTPAANPNPDLRPEVAWQEDGGVEYDASRFKARATYFRADIEDKIVSDSGNLFRADNLADAYTQGVELEFNQGILDSLSHGANYTFLEARGRREKFSGYYNLPLSPKNTANYFVDWTAPLAIEVHSDLRYVDKQTFPNFDGSAETILDPYLLWGLRLSRKFGPLETFLGVENLTETRYATNANPPEFGGGYFPQPGRTFWGGVTLRFS